MRKLLAIFTAVFVALPGVAFSAEQSAAPEEIISFPYAPPHFPWLKTSWLQGLAERFSNYIDVLSLQFSSVLGSWSREPVFFAITPAKILLLLLTLIVGFALAWLARVVILRYHSLGRSQADYRAVLAQRDSLCVTPSVERFFHFHRRFLRFGTDPASYRTCAWRISYLRDCREGG